MTNETRMTGGDGPDDTPEGRPIGIGDVVELRSGSPRLTVLSVGSVERGLSGSCEVGWFEAGEYRTAQLPAASVVRRQAAANDLVTLTDLNLSVRATNVLLNANVNTLGDLVRWSAGELMSLKNFGQTTLDEIRLVLSERGLALRDDPRGGAADGN